jgi:glycosyltransferase involved in cell wall biosynthesis
MSSDLHIPRVSIGLPVYNGERYLASAVESILSQDFSDFELLIGDNGSTDSTPEICARYGDRDPRVRVYRSPENKGAAWNYNRLVDLARGHYFKWAADDDLLDPSFLSRCVEVLDTDPGCVLSYTGVLEIDENGTPLRDYRFPGRYAESPEPIERVTSVLGEHTMCYEIFGLLRRQQLADTSRIGPYYGSDRTLLVELAAVGRFAKVQQVLFRSREHPHRMRYASDWTAWHDTALAGRPTLPTWRLLREYARVIWALPAPVRKKGRGMAALVRWATSRRGFLLRQLALWALHRSIVARPVLRLRHSGRK